VERRRGANLGLYSITPNNNIAFDYPTLNAYKEFRIEAEQKGFRHFLEVFDPNACGGACPHDLGRFINDLIVRTLAGVPRSGRPIFLKIVYHGPQAMEELAAYDPHLVPGILGGSSGTTHDAFKLLEEAKKYGARAALFGRKINNSEHQLTFVRFLHAIVSGQIKADEACRAYHGELQKLNIKPYRALKDDLELTTTATSYAGTGSSVSLAKSPGVAPKPQDKPKPKVTFSGGGSGVPAPRTSGKVVAASVIPRPTGAPSLGGDGSLPKKSDGSPDFSKMSSAQKVAFARRRIASDIARNNGNE
jgi:hypothetical protein